LDPKGTKELFVSQFRGSPNSEAMAGIWLEHVLVRHGALETHGRLFLISLLLVFLNMKNRWDGEESGLLPVCAMSDLLASLRIWRRNFSICY